ncbi:alpha/beta hydrolase [Sporobolomyces koalae]|uniref:alpha/beta hydrolase n=1 Tax=Sporobolomyces koalae TaxID=500713 RepID=UPI00317EB232
MTEYTSHLDIGYESAKHPRQSLDLFIPGNASASSRLLVWIHGGAWRSESKADFVDTLVPRILKLTNLPLAVLEYRLTPEVAHPEHVLDVISGLSLLTSTSLLDCEAGSAKWNRNDLALAGHSVGAFLCCQIALRPPAALASYSVPATVRRSVSSIVVIAGIYDLNDMLDEYPDYASWTGEAIGLDQQTLKVESVANWMLYDDAAGKRLRICVVSGKEDELVSERQADLMVARLKALLGSEDEIRDRLKVDYDTVKGSHDDMLRRDEIPQLWAEFALQK